MAGWKDIRDIAAWRHSREVKRQVFANYARISKASLVEVLNHIIDARDQNLLSEDEYQTRQHEIRRALKATVGLIQHLETTPDPPRPAKKKSEPEP